ncbi:MAG: hypothetical protein ACOVKV_16855 [Novosphingobium sp.]
MDTTYRIVDHGHYVALHAVELDGSGKVVPFSSKPIDFAFDADNGADKLRSELQEALRAAAEAPVIMLADA